MSSMTIRVLCGLVTLAVVIPSAAGQQPPEPAAPAWLQEYKFNRPEFTFVRIQYDTGLPRRVRMWATDYPDADLTFSKYLAEVTSLRVDPQGKVLRLTDERLGEHPFIYICEPGRMSLSDAEVAALRRYLLNGGFLMVDDFWGQAEWDNFQAEMKRVFPERAPKPLPLEHAIFHCVHDLAEKPQVPSIAAFYAGRTSERPDAEQANFQAIYDDQQRMMVVICHNTDLADGWERMDEGGQYAREISRKKALPMGTNIVFYALTQAARQPSNARTAEPTAAREVESYLVEGKLSAARTAMQRRLDRDPTDAPARFAVGIVDTLQAVEKLGQNLYRYGLKPNNRRLPFVRLPVPRNSDPERLTYEKWRGVLQQFINDLDAAQKSLAKVDDDRVQLKLPVGLIRLDLNGDGKSLDGETFWQVFTTVAWRAAKLDEDQKRFEIGFDKADVHWMIGYTHLLRAMAEAWLAYDTQHFFDQTAPFFFDGASSPLTELGSNQSSGMDMDEIANLIAAIHLVHFDVAEPKRMETARQHLLQMITQSRQVWEHATSETDDDREWIPNASQTSLTPLTVNQQRVEGWRQFLDEAEAVLNGEKLLPHWRVGDGRGINLKRVFTEPRTFDLVLWAHGSAAIPYLEEGEVVSAETAATLNRTFEGRFVVFAIWFQ